jgi:hypothetical protein
VSEPAISGQVSTAIRPYENQTFCRKEEAGRIGNERGERIIVLRAEGLLPLNDGSVLGADAVAFACTFPLQDRKILEGGLDSPNLKDVGRSNIAESLALPEKAVVSFLNSSVTPWADGTAGGREARMDRFLVPVKSLHGALCSR